jgi:hypothetical protein
MLRSSANLQFTDTPTFALRAVGGHGLKVAHGGGARNVLHAVEVVVRVDNVADELREKEKSVNDIISFFLTS